MKDQFKKYMWILDLLYSTGGITFKEMAEQWKRSELNDRQTILAKRTFDDYRRAIEETFDVDIICDASRGYQYRIDDARTLSKDRIKQWLLSSFAVNNILQGSRRLSERIVYEEIPSGNDYLLEVVKAMQKDRMIRVTYDNFFEKGEQHLLIAPYCVKVFRQRWYVIGKAKGQKVIWRWALDRFLRMEIAEQKFRLPKDFFAEFYFRDAFGVIVDEEECSVETIRLKVYSANHRDDYLRHLPLHSSQRETEKHKDFAIFEYRLRPAYDFCQELLSYGEEVEVLSPQYLRDYIADRLHQAVNRYK
jgi:hypothetical protein